VAISGVIENIAAAKKKKKNSAKSGYHGIA